MNTPPYSPQSSQIELTASLSIRQLWRLVIQEWKCNPLVPLARRFEWQRIVILFLFMVMCRALTEAIYTYVPSGFWELRGAAAGWYSYEMIVYLLHGAIWCWIAWGAFARLVETGELAAVPLSRTSWIVGPALPLLLGVFVCNFLIESFLHIRYWKWMAESWSQFVSAVNFEGKPTMAEKVLTIIGQVLAPFRSILAFFSLLLIAFIIAERSILSCQRREDVTLRLVIRLLMPLILLRLWQYFTNRLYIAIDNFVEIHMPIEPSFELSMAHIHVIPLANGIICDVFMVFGALWLFRFFLRRDLPKFGNSFPSVE